MLMAHRIGYDPRTASGSAAVALEVGDLQREDGRSRSRLPQHHAQRQPGSPGIPSRRQPPYRAL